MPERPESILDELLLDGPLLPIPEVEDLLLGKHHAPSTRCRIVLKGLFGGTIKLPAVRCGREWRTTVRAYQAFLAAQSAAARAKVARSDGPAERSPEMTRRLDEAGLLSGPTDNVDGRPDRDAGGEDRS